MQTEIEIQGNEEDFEIEQTPEELAAAELAAAEIPPEDESDEIVISLGEEVVTPKADDEKAPAPEWVKELRKRTKEQEKTIREQQAQLDALKIPDQKAALGKKPSMSDDGIDYDEDAFAAAMEKWYDNKRVVDAEEAKKREQAELQEKSWNEKLQGYQEGRTKLAKIEDFEEAEATAMQSLSSIQQGIIVSTIESAPHVMYALGKNPEKLKELKAITDPIQFTAALIRLESKMTVTRKPATAPEKTVTGNTAIGGINDKTLDRLREEGVKSGDMSKVIAYKKQLREKSR